MLFFYPKLILKGGESFMKKNDYKQKTIDQFVEYLQSLSVEQLNDVTLGMEEYDDEAEFTLEVSVKKS